MPSFIALGCLEVGEKFPVGGCGHFDSNYYVTPTLSWVRLRLRLGCNNYFRMLQDYFR